MLGQILSVVNRVQNRELHFAFVCLRVGLIKIYYVIITSLLDLLFHFRICYYFSFCNCVLFVSGKGHCFVSNLTSNHSFQWINFIIIWYQTTTSSSALVFFSSSSFFSFVVPLDNATSGYNSFHRSQPLNSTVDLFQKSLFFCTQVKIKVMFLCHLLSLVIITTNGVGRGRAHSTPRMRWSWSTDLYPINPLSEA